jgi:hypothetical protein
LPSVQALSERLWVADWRVVSPASAAAYDIRVAVSHDAGATWSPSSLLNEDATPSEHGFVSWFRDGERAAAVWLDGRDEAAGAPEPPAGEPAGWSEPARLGPDHWQIAGCPINGPALDAGGNDVVAAWFTAADGHGRVRMARSGDGGVTFGAAVDIDSDGAYGQVGVALAEGGEAFVSWWRRAADGGAELAVRAVARDGELGERRVVGTTRASRPDTVPQMKRAGRRLVFVWTEDTDAGQAVRTAYAEIGGGA